MDILLCISILGQCGMWVHTFLTRFINNVIKQVISVSYASIKLITV